MDEGGNWRATIGWIKPGPVSKLIDQFFVVTPPDVNVVISTTMWSLKMTNAREFDPESLEGGQATMLQMARDLMAYEPMDFIAVTGDLYQAALGPEWNRTMREAVEHEAGVPATTAMTAVVEALREMGVTRPVLGSPVSEAKNAPVREYLEASGFTVPAMVGLDAGSSRALRRLPREAPYEVALRAFEAGQAAGGTDGIYLPSLSWGATRFAARLEAELGVPVVTLYNSLVWRALSAIGYPTPMTGYGAILERVGD